MKTFFALLFSIAFVNFLYAQENGGPYTADNNTVLLMHFDGNATNAATVGNNGIVHGSGVSFETGIHNQCIRLDNSTWNKQSWIEVPFYNELNFTEEFSIECWFKLNSWGENLTGARSLFKKEGINGAMDYEVILYPEGKSLTANLDCIDDENGQWDANAKSSDFLELNRWYHIAMYYNHAHKHLYCLIRDENYNEIYASRSYSETPPVNNTGKFMIGYGGWTESCFDGWIDEFRISNKYRKYRDDVLKDVDINNFKDEVFLPLKDGWTVYQWPLDSYYPLNKETEIRDNANSCGPTMLMRTIHFWEHPRFPSGIINFEMFNADYHADFDHTEYLWDQIPKTFPSGMTEKDYAPAATFSAQVGTASMKFFDYMYCMPKFLKENFHFSEKTRVLFEEEYTKEEWENIFKNELNHGRPIMVGGVTERTATGGSGHYYICNGYNSKNEFFTDYSFNDNYWNKLDDFVYGTAQDIIIFIEPDWDNKSLTLSNPLENGVYKAGSELDIKWETDNITNVILEYSIDAGYNWQTIADNVDASVGNFKWTVPGDLAENYKIRISDKDDLNVYRRTGKFSVFDQKQFTFTYPNQNTTLTGGLQNPIYWESVGILAFKLEYSVDGQNWITMSDSIHCKEHFEFDFPDENKENVLVRATDLSEKSLSFQSEPFSLFKDPNNIFQHPVDENTVLLMHFEDNLTNAANNELKPIEGMPIGYYIDNFDQNLGKAFRFDNSDGTPITHNVWVDNSEDLDLGNNWSIEAWVNVRSIGGEKNVVGIIFDKWDAFGLNAAWNHFNAFVNFENGTNVEFTYPTAYALNQWYHIALISDAKTAQFYFYIHDSDFNKIYEDHKYFPDGSDGLIAKNENLLKIGGLGGASNYEYDGFMDEIRISKTSYLLEYKPIIYAELPFYDDFSNDYKNWSTTSVVGADMWHISGDDGIGGSRCARFYITSNPQQTNNDWLVSKVFNTHGVSNLSITFKYWYHDGGISPEFYYANSFDGDPATINWTPIDNSFWKNEWTWNEAKIEIENPGESFVFAIRYQSTSNSSNYLLIDNLEIKSNLTGISVSSNPEIILNIYPNPVTGESVISFQTKSNGEVNLSVFDIQGREICTLLDKKLNAGKHTVQLGNQIKTNGVYLCKLTTSEGVSTLKLIVNQ
jgi:hypothetical protein